MGLRGNQHFRRELQTWLDEGLVTPETANTLTSRYELDREPPWYQRSGFIVSALAIVMAILGLLLVISQNWAFLGRFLQSSIGLAPLMAAYAAGLIFLRQNKRDRAELAFFTASALFGVNIFLQGQIYHLPGDWPEGILLWAFGTFPVAWVFRSTLLLIGTLLLLFFWQFLYILPLPPQYLGLVLLGLSIYLLRYVTGWPALLVAAANIWVVMFRLDAWLGHPRAENHLPYFTLVIVLGAASAGVFRILSTRYDERFSRQMERLGEFLAIILLYLATFDEILKETTRSAFVWGIPLAWAIIALTVLKRWPRKAQWLAIVGAGFYTVVWSLGLLVHGTEIYALNVAAFASWVANLLFFLGSIYLIYNALQVRSRRSFLTGIFTLLLLVITRYVELADDYLTAALLFFLASAVLFVANRYWQRNIADREDTP